MDQILTYHIPFKQTVEKKRALTYFFDKWKFLKRTFRKIC